MTTRKCGLFSRSCWRWKATRCSQACNGKEAQAYCRETPFDLVITDLVMPEQEGLETIHAIRQNWPQIPMIAISGAFGGTYLELAKKLGADAVFRKPFEPETILSEVRRLISGSRGQNGC